MLMIVMRLVLCSKNIRKATGSTAGAGGLYGEAIVTSLVGPHYPTGRQLENVGGWEVLWVLCGQMERLPAGLVLGLRLLHHV